MNRIALIAAFPGELKPLVQGWERRGGLFVGHIGPHEAIAAAAGMGADAAVRACEAVRAQGGVDTLISMGWAGSLSCGLRPPDAVAVREVVDAASGERFATGSAQGQRLVTLNHVAAAPEKRRLAEKYQAALVDMEAGAVAQFARTRGFSFYCFKGITDGPNDKLPDFARFTGADSQLRMGSFLLWSLLHPQSWSVLGRLGKNSREAAARLAEMVPRCLADQP